MTKDPVGINELSYNLSLLTGMIFLGWNARKSRRFSIPWKFDI